MPSPPWPKRIVSPCQLMPYGREASQIGTAGPPPTLIRLIVFSDQNAIERPSGEKTGFRTPAASSVEGIGVASSPATGRR
jgi:hypothetical protein